MNVTITRPTLVLNRDICLHNIRFMADKARTKNLAFRPHFKTHQSRTVGRWFRDYGVDRITVSSVCMAAYFAEDGWSDITLAFPVNLREIREINRLNADVRLKLLISSEASIPLLDQMADRPIEVFMEIEAGYHRSGFDVGKPDRIRDAVNSIQQSRHLRFLGFLSHNGHTYHASSAAEVVRLHEASLQKLQALKTGFESPPGNPLLSLGDTPSCSLAEDFSGVDEIRPGNFVFYDWMQHQLGACRENQIAVRLVCPVVAVYPEKNQAVVHGGAIHLSKEGIRLPDGQTRFGAVAGWNEGNWEPSWKNCYVSSLSQEHGIITLSDEKNGSLKPGGLVSIIPIHSCLTADAMGEFFSVEGERIEHMRGR